MYKTSSYKNVPGKSPTNNDIDIKREYDKLHSLTIVVATASVCTVIIVSIAIIISMNRNHFGKTTYSSVLDGKAPSVSESVSDTPYIEDGFYMDDLMCESMRLVGVSQCKCPYCDHKLYQYGCVTSLPQGQLHCSHCGYRSPIICNGEGTTIKCIEIIEKLVNDEIAIKYD